MAPTNMKHQSRIAKPKARSGAPKQGNARRQKLMVVLKLPKQAQTSPFLTKIPAEIRLMIYEYALAPDTRFWFLKKDNYARDKKHPFPVIDVCQTFRSESMELYGKWLEKEVAFAESKARATRSFEGAGTRFKKEHSSSSHERRLVKLRAEERRLRKMGYTD